MTDAERQRSYLSEKFRLMGIPNPRIHVEDENIVVWTGEPMTDFWLMEIGSDDDRYRFELWHEGRDSGIYVEFALEGETL